MAWGRVAPAFGVFRAAGGRQRWGQAAGGAAAGCPQSSVRCGPLLGLSLACAASAGAPAGPSGAPHGVRWVLGSGDEVSLF